MLMLMLLDFVPSSFSSLQLFYLYLSLSLYLTLVVDAVLWCAGTVYSVDTVHDA